MRTIEHIDRELETANQALVRAEIRVKTLQRERADKLQALIEKAA